MGFFIVILMVLVVWWISLFIFTLSNGVTPIAIESMGLHWDLHNCMNFCGFCQNIPTRTVELRWEVDHRYTKQTFPSEQFSILFTDVQILEVIRRDRELPFS